MCRIRLRLLGEGRLLLSIRDLLMLLQLALVPLNFSLRRIRPRLTATIVVDAAEVGIAVAEVGTAAAEVGTAADELAAAAVVAAADWHIA
jgi:hypothetical protein